MVLELKLACHRATSSAKPEEVVVAAVGVVAP